MKKAGIKGSIIFKAICIIVIPWGILALLVLSWIFFRGFLDRKIIESMEGLVDCSRPCI